MTAATPVTLLTGATGFLGADLTRRFLALGDTVRCVTRGATDAERISRLRTAVGALAPGVSERLEAVPGDLAEPGLGLPEDEFVRLGTGVTRVVHCGARVNMTLPYASLHSSNVAATESLLALAEARGASFCHIGSLAAVAHTVTGEPFELIDPVAGGYAQSKWAADRLVSAAHQEQRLKATILRPGRVTADSRTARSNPGDLLEQIIRCCVRLGAVPELTGSVRLSPVDWVASLMVTLSGRADAHGRAYHLVSEETLPWRDTVDVLLAAGYGLAGMPYAKWRALVYEAGREDTATARLATSLPEEPLVFDDRPALRPARARAQLGVEYPMLPPAATLLARTAEAWRARGDLPSPSAVPGRDPQGAR